MIENAQQYKEFVAKLREELISLGESIPTKAKREVMLKTAVELEMSFMTVSNYLTGFGKNPETSLLIKEKISELILPNKPNK